jgi:murein DD-endopeptidase MepM/ murein hydrolase activator NlpD
LLNALGGVLRATARLRPTDRDRSLTVKYLHRRAVRITRQVVDRLAPVPTRRRSSPALAPRHLASRRFAASTTLSDPQATRVRGSRSVDWVRIARLRLMRRFKLDPRLLRVRLSSERGLPIIIAFVVILASVVSLGPGAVKPVGAAEAQSQALRIAVGGTSGELTDDPELLGLGGRTADRLGAYVDDGTIYKPVAVDTTVESGSSLLRHYKVRSGDTLTAIASRFGISMMTLWWANNLSTKDSLKLGQSLVIPPVDGLVVTVKVGDTLDGYAAQYKVDQASVMDLNGLTDPNLVVGQVLVLPGAQGAPLPTAAPTPKPTPRTSTSTYTAPKVPTYSGGSWAWPVPGGYVSQYFHYGHYGIDVAAHYGTAIVSPLAGTVIWAGWKANGGGYQVWINHGGGIYTAHHHMSSVLVHVGQYVGRGQQIGRVGTSGWATGPHDHFEVWIGYPWTGGSYRVNPLRYY